MGDTPPIRKFMFERSFDKTRDASGHDRRPVTYSYEQLEALKKSIYDAAFAAGRKMEAEEQAKRLMTAVAQIGNHIGHLLQQAATARQEQETRVREAVLAIARKVLPDFSQRNGLQEIQAIVAGIIGEMAGEPRLAVRVNEGQFDAVDAALKSVTEQQGYAGKIVLMADPAVAAGDCRIEWSDGGIERNLEALWQNIGKTLAPDQDQTPAASAAAG